MFGEQLLFSLRIFLILIFFFFFLIYFPHRITHVFIQSTTLGIFVNPITFKLGTFINPNPLGCVQNRIQIGGFGTVRVNEHL